MRVVNTRVLVQGDESSTCWTSQRGAGLRLIKIVDPRSRNGRNSARVDYAYVNQSSKTTVGATITMCEMSIDGDLAHCKYEWAFDICKSHRSTQVDVYVDIISWHFVNRHLHLSRVCRGSSLRASPRTSCSRQCRTNLTSYTTVFQIASDQKSSNSIR